MKCIRSNLTQKLQVLGILFPTWDLIPHVETILPTWDLGYSIPLMWDLGYSIPLMWDLGYSIPWVLYTLGTLFPSCGTLGIPLPLEGIVHETTYHFSKVHFMVHYKHTTCVPKVTTLCCDAYLKPFTSTSEWCSVSNVRTERKKK